MLPQSVFKRPLSPLLAVLFQLPPPEFIFQKHKDYIFKGQRKNAGFLPGVWGCIYLLCKVWDNCCLKISFVMEVSQQGVASSVSLSIPTSPPQPPAFTVLTFPRILPLSILIRLCQKLLGLNLWQPVPLISAKCTLSPASPALPAAGRVVDNCTSFSNLSSSHSSLSL